MSKRRISLRDERGVSIFLFAILLPVILALGAVVLDVGNWYVHKRHLQTQVDAAALAGGSQLTGCQQDAANANSKTTQQALLYAGDPTRQPLTKNQQVQVASKAHVVLNSQSFWSSGTTLGAAGYTSTPDFTETADADSPKLGPTGGPCYLGWIDVKATDQNVPKIWGLIPGTTSPKTVARVELDQVQSLTGALPLGLNELDAQHVYAIVVDENVANWQTNPAGVVGHQELKPQNPAPSGLGGFQVYQNDGSSGFGALTADMGTAGNYGVVILTTYNSGGASFSGSLDTICGQNPTPAGQVQCFAYDGGGTDVSFIHTYSGGSAPPAVRDVKLVGGCGTDQSAPYFNLDADCNMQVQAQIDLGVSGGTDPGSNNNCFHATSSPGGTMTWSNTGGVGTWTSPAFAPMNASGQNVVDITVTQDAKLSNCSGKTSTYATFPSVAAAYAADDNSGPLQYVWVTPWGSSTAANSMNKTASASLQVTVGFEARLVDAPITDPPILFRLSRFNTPSQTQALDCGSGAAGFRNAIVNGCPGFVVNQRSGLCSPTLTPYPDCIDSENGAFSVGSAYQDRFTPDGCAKDPNNWNRNGYTIPPPQDPRWGILFIMDPLAFQASGKKTYPIRRFVAVYVTAGDGLNCPGDVPASGVPRNSLYGHVVSYVTPDPTATASQTKCSFTDGNVCVPVLVK